MSDKIASPFASAKLMELSDMLRNAANVSKENERLTRENYNLLRRLDQQHFEEEMRRLRKENSDQRDEIKRLRIGHQELKQKAGEQKHRADCLQHALDRIKKT